MILKHVRYRHLTSPRSRPPRTGAPDGMLIAALWVLVLVGLLALASASSAYSYQRYGSAYRVVFHQLLVGFLPGVILFWFFLRRDYHRWQKYGGIFFLLTVSLLLGVFLPGVGQDYNRARSWIEIGPLNFQPAEVAKLTAIMTFAAWFARTGFQRLRYFGRGFLGFAARLAVILGLIALQPDFGTMAVLGVILVTMYYVAGARFLHLAILAGLALSSVLVLVSVGGYRADRIAVFLQPNADSQSSGYHAKQAEIAIGSGGWLGRGLGKSHQKFAYLPEVSADSIFAIIAEEFGFVATAAFVCLYALLVLRTLHCARTASDPFGRFLAVGVATWFGFQGFLNMAVMVGLAPITGLPLPFVSAGGTALVSNLTAAGLVLNISKQANN